MVLKFTIAALSAAIVLLLCPVVKTRLETLLHRNGGPEPTPAFSQQQASRKVNGQVLSSPKLPKVTLEFDKAFKYVGTQSFVLYDVANAEQHFFVDASKDRRVKRLYWIQFEGYLPNNTHSYDYQPNKVVKIGHLDFIVDAYARNTKTTPSRAGSDGNRARDFLKSKGFTIGDEIIFQRLVHLTDNTKRNELMIIYLEDLSMLGMTAAELAPGGAKAASWEAISSSLLERAIKGLKVGLLTWLPRLCPNLSFLCVTSVLSVTLWW